MKHYVPLLFHLSPLSNSLKPCFSDRLLAADGPCYDGIITLSIAAQAGGLFYYRSGFITSAQQDFFTLVEHETNEILGTSSAIEFFQGGNPVFIYPADLYRYQSNGARSFAAGNNSPCASDNAGNACFSIDGVHMLLQYNNVNGLDFGDWLTTYEFGGCQRVLVQNAGGCPGFGGVDISRSAEILLLDVIGYTLVGISTSATSLYFAAPLSQLQTVGQYVEVESVNGPAIGFTTSVTTESGGDWLTAEPGGTTPQSLGVSIGTAGPTTPGTYEGTITITPTTPDYTPVNIQVTYVVSATAPATPVITDVENGASFQSGYFGNSIWTIKGTNLASITGSDNWNNSIMNGELPTSLDGVTVLFGQVPGYISYLSPTQINVVTPNGGSGDVLVNNNGALSAPFQAYPPGLVAPAFFTWPNNQVVATRTDYSYAVAPGTFSGLTTVAAKPGDVLILFGTGFGPTAPAVQDGAVVPGDQEYATSTTPTVTVGGVSARVYGAALAAGYAGLYQVAIQVPSTLGAGTWPIVATMGTIDGVQSPTNVVLVVKP